MAGESTGDVARSRRDRAAQRLRAAASSGLGAAGEASAAALLDLPSDGWRVFHAVRWPNRPAIQIDQVAVGPAGVFVIHTEDWSGEIEVRDQVLMRDGERQESAVAGVADAAIAVAELVPGLDPNLVTPVLCLVRGEAVEGCSRDVLICSTSNLVEMLTALDEVLDTTGTITVFATLASSLPAAGGSAAGARTSSPLKVTRPREPTDDLQLPAVEHEADQAPEPPAGRRSKDTPTSRSAEAIRRAAQQPVEPKRLIRRSPASPANAGQADAKRAAAKKAAADRAAARRSAAKKAEAEKAEAEKAEAEKGAAARRTTPRRKATNQQAAKKAALKRAARRPDASAAAVRKTAAKRPVAAARSESGGAPKVIVQHAPVETGRAGLGRWLAVLAAIVVSLVAFAALSGVLRTGELERVTRDFLDSRLYPTAAAGEPISVDASGTRPALEIVETALTLVRPPDPSQRAPRGERLWGVRFTLTNQGETPLRTPWPTRATVKDDQGAFHTVEPRVTEIAQGDLLATRRPVPPGESVTGYLVFQVPSSAQVAEAWLRFGSETARWKLGER